jgi:plasmid stabilization system protein ParE
MSYKFEILPEAIIDVEEIFLWYQTGSPQLADSFQSKLELAFKEIQLNPFAYHSLNSKGRCRKLRRFPYLVIYAVKKELISVVAVLHEKRNPKTWKRRLRKK